MNLKIHKLNCIIQLLLFILFIVSGLTIEFGITGMLIMGAVSGILFPVIINTEDNP